MPRASTIPFGRPTRKRERDLIARAVRNIRAQLDEAQDYASRHQREHRVQTAALLLKRLADDVERGYLPGIERAATQTIESPLRAAK